MRRIVKGQNGWRRWVTFCAWQRAEALGWNTAAAAAAAVAAAAAAAARAMTHHEI